MSRKVGMRCGFTLVELLVVVGIIAILAALLLPALKKAQAAARTASCLGNLRSIGQAMNIYAAENKGWLPGSGWTTGAMFWKFGGSSPQPISYPVTNCPGISESNDWIGPLARLMGIKNPDIDGNDSIARYKAYRELGWMICPSYRDMIVPAGDPTINDGNAGPGQGLSYCTSLTFLERAWESFGVQNQPTGRTDLNGNLIPQLSGNGKAIVILPKAYVPLIFKIGDNSRKIFAADGGRATIPVAGKEQSPVYVISGNPVKTNWDATSFADVGAFGGWSHSAYRTAVFGNADATPKQDIRIWAYRHGTWYPFQKAGMYRMNVVFFDGHCETLDDVQSSNPALWMPKGSVIYPFVGASGSSVAGTKTVWADARPIFCPGITNNSQTWTSP